MKKIAFINQRYGLEVNGGSEFYTREIVEHIKDRFQVEVLTTKALDYTTWEDHYTNDVEDINGITVRRFSVDKTREMKAFSKLTTEIEYSKTRTREQEEDWAERQGPASSALIHYIESNADNYDVFIFVTYLYYPTLRGLPKVCQKSLLIPTAHDEPYIYFDIYRDVFIKPKGIIFLTEEERDFVHHLFRNESIKNDVIAVGIDIPNKLSPIEFKHRHNLDKYIIYAGRIDTGKLCDVMFANFLNYKMRNPKDKIQLALIGKQIIDIPKHKDIRYLGFLSEEEKFSAILGSFAMVSASKFESLSIAILEAMALSKPVIVNAESEVMKAHCLKSNAGLYFSSSDEFEGCIKYLDKNHDVYRKMTQNATIYVKENYTWSHIIEKFSNMIDYTEK